MAEQDYATRCAPPGRADVPADGWTVSGAAHRARRTFSRESKTCGGKDTALDSVDRSTASHTVAGPDADTPQVPQQTAAVDLQGPSGRNARQRAASLCRWPIAAFQKATTNPW